MKKGIFFLLLAAVSGTALYGCTNNGHSSETVTNMNIPVEDITDFYYTYENINFDAFYQRYRFYMEDGRHMFHHETREKPGEYGWTSEADITFQGTFELNEEEWNAFIDQIREGTVKARSDSDESGDSGPWLYIYWKKDQGKYQEFSFLSRQNTIDFESFCKDLAESRTEDGK